MKQILFNFWQEYKTSSDRDDVIEKHTAILEKAIEQIRAEEREKLLIALEEGKKELDEKWEGKARKERKKLIEMIKEKIISLRTTKKGVRIGSQVVLGHKIIALVDLLQALNKE